METKQERYEQPDYSLPQAVPSEAAPEVYGYPTSELPEAVYVLPPTDRPREHSTLPLPEAIKAEKEEGDEELLRRVRPWWRRKRWLIPAAIVASAVLGGIIGNRFGKRSETSDSPAASPSGLQSVCRGTVCPQILAAAALGQDNTDLTLMVFARGMDNDIWHSSSPAAKLTSWPKERAWLKLGGGPFLSQPSALAWFNWTRVSVAAVSDPDHSVKMLRFADRPQDANPQWESLSGPVTSALTVCTVNGTRPDFWTANGKDVAHNPWKGNATADIFWSPGIDRTWLPTTDFGANLSTRPAISCRHDAYYHDLVVYGEDGAVRHSAFKDGMGWTTILSRGGKFVGEPVVLTVGDARFDFFGVAAGDGAMHHFTWTKAGGYTAMERLGGSFQSVPSAVMTGSVSDPRIDVVALGTNDLLWHRALKGSKWSADWEVLNVFGNSAPLLANITAVEPQRIAVFVMGTDGQVNQTTWTVSEDFKWGNLTWTSMGGNMTTEYYRS